MMARTGFGIALGFLAVVTGVVCAAVAGMRRQRARHEERQRLEMWEGEGGALLGAAAGTNQMPPHPRGIADGKERT